jgi:uncharacterized membrane protein
MFRKLFAIIAGVIFLIGFPASKVKAEEISDFDVLVTVKTDGMISVQESIRYDFGSTERHGIIRYIPITKTNVDGKPYELTFSKFEVTDENNYQYAFTDTKSDGNISLKIGDANRTISGLHTYIIRYDVAGAITYYSDHDELYWNSTGNEWTIPIQKASFEVILPVTISASEIKSACFTGISGSKNTACTTTVNSNRATVNLSGLLGPNEGLTAVIGFPRNIVQVLEPTPIAVSNGAWSEVVTIFLIAISFIWYIGLPIAVIVMWFKFGRDPKPPIGQAHVWFDIPKSKKLRQFTPAEIGTLNDETVDMRDITATIVDLARRGYLKIVEKKKNDFSLIKAANSAKDDMLEPFEKYLYDGIFSTGMEMRIKDTDLASEVAETKRKLYAAVVNEGLFSKNPETTRTIYTVLAVMALFTGNFLLAIVGFVFGRSMPKKTIFGSETNAVTNAMKNFIKSQDKELEFQAKNQMFFEKFLPYAVALGVEKIWAERFKDIQMNQPDWYSGYGNNAFTTAYLVNSLNHSFGDFTRAATPTRSSSGFSSGFSGGGFSGGGGGGGGGGSW